LIAYVVFGKIDNTTIELSTIANGTGGFIIDGEIQYDRSGASVSNAGDVNGDGLDDLIVGARNAGLNDKTEIGKSYNIFGKIDSTAINLSAIAKPSPLTSPALETKMVFQLIHTLSLLMTKPPVPLAIWMI
jgi:hypothetical protein